MKNKNTLILSGVVFLAFLLRFLFLGSLPPSLTWDEASWGYNAYSLGTDGRDEFGKFLPVTYLESFGDYKPPLYAYLAILPVKIFGLNEFSSRFPSALFGTLTVLLTYYLVREIFGKEKESIALLSAFLLAISPWHIMLSRAAFEANVANFFIALGILLFLKGLQKPKLLPLSSISFILAMSTFNSARIFVPIIVIIFAFIFYKKLLKQKLAIIITCIIGLLMFLPLLLFLQTPQAKLRFNEVNIFLDPALIVRTNTEMQNSSNAAWSKIIHNRRFAYGVEYVRHYIDNISPTFLFVKGDGNPKFSIQDVGELYLWEIPFFIAGLLLLFRKRDGYWWIVPIWIVVGIIPAGFARETPHALRIESTVPMFQIVTALGVIGLLKFIPKKFKLISVIGISIIVSFGLIYFLQNYTQHYSKEFSGEWQYGYKESINYVESVKDRYKSVYVTEELGRPYVYYLFHMKYPPQVFRKEANIFRETLGFVHVLDFSNIHFTKKISTVTEKGALYIATPGEKPEGALVEREFKLLNGQTALVAYTL